MRIKPLGAQLEGCKEALARAIASQESVRIEVQSATTALETATNEVTNLQKQLTSLESAVAKSRGGDPSVQPQTMNSVDGLAVALERVLQEMKAGQGVPEPMIDTSQEQMQSLYKNIQSTSAAVASKANPPASAASRRSAAAADATGDSSSVAGPPPAVLRRTNGKNGSESTSAAPAGRGMQSATPSVGIVQPAAGEAFFAKPEGSGNG